MRRVHGRHTEVAPIGVEDARTFLSLHSDFPSVGRAKALISLGLVDKSSQELLAVALFCAPRTSKMAATYSVELLRLAFKTGVRVPGGASKILAHYRRVYHPADIFTYQDATGELTDVYEHCGFTLVSQAKTKQYLVAPGKTLATGDRRRKEILAMNYATKWGPDNILGTKLGEVVDPETGERKSNRRIFLEELGWHLEEAPGDRVYEWINPDLTFYTYKITATDSNKYYYGVSHVKKANATVEDCLTDGYWGSGGAKFKNWRERHADHLSKKVMGIYRTRQAAFKAEGELVGESYRLDRACLNSTAGGARTALSVQRSLVEFTPKLCSVHGETLHRGKTCLRCFALSLVSLQECPVHGLVKHRGSVCYLCLTAESITLKLCHEHGLVHHRGESCAKCSAQASVTLRVCPVHGNTKHRGETCYQCSNNESIQSSVCAVHGLVPHRGDRCLSCAKSASITVDLCEKHGLTKFSRRGCFRCASPESEDRICPIHGMTTFIGSACAKCRSSNAVSERTCPVHGLTKHKGEVCYRCEAENSISIRECAVHGKTKFRGEQCCRCHNAKSSSLRACPVHGLVKHSGDRCCTCTAQKARHTRHHRGVTVEDCHWCKTD